MHLTYLQYITPSRLGGAEDYFLRLVRSLREAGHRVIVVTKGNTPLRAEIERLDVELHAWHTRGKFDPVTLWKLCRLIRRERVDIINTHLTTASWMGSIAGRLTRVPVVAHVHAADSKTFFQHANYLVAIAQGVKDHLTAQGVAPERIPLLYYGIDLERYSNPLPTAEAKERLGLPPDARTIGVVGHLSERKGHRFLLEALHQAEPRTGPVHALFAGEGVLEATLREQAQALGMADRVHFLGFRRDVVNVVSAFDVFVLPSLKEGLSIAVMEAMALRRPVIATAIAGLPEVVRDGETGLLVPAANAEALAEALARTLCDKSLAEALARNGRTFLERHFDQRLRLREVDETFQRIVAAWRRREIIAF
jgi:glycosyltransferase involved in cell wall biosynthesis